MAAIKGITVILYEKAPAWQWDPFSFEKGEIVRDDPVYDPFDVPDWVEQPIEVHNVLVSPSSADDVISSTQLYGKKAVYLLGIPKGDDHNWEDRIIEFFGKRWRSFGPVLEGIESMIPLDWNRKVMVERYDG